MKVFPAIVAVLLFSFPALALPSLDAEQRTKKRILFVATGGTIACVKGPDGLAPSLKVEKLLSFVPELRSLKNFEAIQLFQLDSTNMHPKNWQTLAREIHKRLERFDGVVVLHGTDTMAFSASALAVMLAPNKPVVLTGAMEPMGTPGGDAEGNLIDAVRVALHGAPGVTVAMNGKNYPAERVFKKNSRERDAFALVEGEAETIDAVLSKSVAPPSRPSPLRDGLVSEVLTLRLQPGLKASFLEKMDEAGIKALLIPAYGMGGIPFQGEDLLPALKHLMAHGVPVVVASQCPFGCADLSVYQVGVKALEAGVVPVEHSSIEYATVRLMSSLYYGKDRAQVQRLLRGL